MLYYTKLYENLYRQSIYEHVSGGDPLAIPNLTHDQLVRFHQNHYNAHNAKFFTYGK
jgi:Zn-dependent M16 (insulinase) family peptidase